MNTNIQEAYGNWNLGYSLDKHVLKSTPTGYNEYGYQQFDTERSEAGEALFQLKYREDFSQVPIIAQQLATSFGSVFRTASLVIPMPPSTPRPRQPVIEIAEEFAGLLGIPCELNLLEKTTATPPVKDVGTREQRVEALLEAFTVNEILAEEIDVLLVDDLFDTGASLEAATSVLRTNSKIRNIYVATVTRRR